MTKLVDLYNHAKKQDIPIFCLELNKREAFSCLDNDGSCYIKIDPNKIENELDEKMKIAHELGHCETGSFYNRWATCDIREKHECRAERWTIKKFLPKEELRAAIMDHRGKWEISEMFGSQRRWWKKPWSITPKQTAPRLSAKMKWCKL